MKDRIIVDIGKIMDEVFEAAENFSDMMHTGMNFGPRWAWDDKIDYYPAYLYPPSNVYMTKEKNMVFEFALAGFTESDITLEFIADYMYFSAREPASAPQEEEVRYFKRRLKLKAIEQQKFYVPADKFDRDLVKAVFKNGILKVTIPAKEEVKAHEGVKIEIVKEQE